MRGYLSINGHDIGAYIPEDGFAVTPEDRVSKRITCLNGDIYERTLKKYKITAKLHDRLYDTAYTLIKSYLSPNPAVVEFSDFDTGITYTGTFYVKDNGYTGKKTYAGITELSGCSLTLEEAR